MHASYFVPEWESLMLTTPSALKTGPKSITLWKTSPGAAARLLPRAYFLFLI